MHVTEWGKGTLRDLSGQPRPRTEQRLRRGVPTGGQLRYSIPEGCLEAALELQTKLDCPVLSFVISRTVVAGVSAFLLMFLCSPPTPGAFLYPGRSIPGSKPQTLSRCGVGAVELGLKVVTGPVSAR